MAHSSLHSVIEIFSSNLGIHRINVMNDQGRVHGLLSKTDVVRFLLSKADIFGDAIKKTLKEIGIGMGPVVSVSGMIYTLSNPDTTSKFISIRGIGEDERIQRVEYSSC